jgi:tetrahydromethanopterin S-methyltransferase subunit F
MAGRRIGILLVVSALVNVGVSLPAKALDRTDQAVSNGVTMTVIIAYNAGLCSGSDTFKITGLAVKFVRNRNDQTVPKAHLAAFEWGETCNGAAVDRLRTTTFADIAFTSNKSGKLSVSNFPSWEYVAPDACLVCDVGGWGHMHTQVTSPPFATGTACARVTFGGFLQCHEDAHGNPI